MDPVDEELDKIAIDNGVCPDCGNELDYPSRKGSYLNRDQFKSVTTNKYCRKCDICFAPGCKNCPPKRKKVVTET